MNTDEDLAPLLLPSEVHKRLDWLHVRRLALKAGCCTYLLDMVMSPQRVTSFHSVDDPCWSVDPVTNKWILPPTRGTIFQHYDCVYKRPGASSHYLLGDEAAEIYDRIMFITEKFGPESQEKLFRTPLWTFAKRAVLHIMMEQAGWDSSRSLAELEFYRTAQRAHEYR